MPRTVDDYPDIVEISKSVILELWRCLHKYNDAMTLIGGWAPYFILERYGRKSYDLYYLVTYYKNGPKDVADEINNCISDALVKEALATIKKDFSSRDSPGPIWIANFLNELEGDIRERRLTDVFMNINEFLENIRE